MSHKKYFKNITGAVSPISGANSNQGAWNNNPGTGGWNNHDMGYKNYMSRLPEVYTGHPNRLERYNQYEMMDVDAEVNACLDIISEFSTQRNEHNKTPFDVEFSEDSIPETITGLLRVWLSKPKSSTLFITPQTMSSLEPILLLKTPLLGSMPLHSRNTS